MEWLMVDHPSNMMIAGYFVGWNRLWDEGGTDVRPSTPGAREHQSPADPAGVGVLDLVADARRGIDGQIRRGDLSVSTFGIADEKQLPPAVGFAG